MKWLCFLLLGLISLPAWSWNAIGHRVIAVIAADHLTPKAKQQSQYLIDYLANAYPYSSSWQMASVWLDLLRQDGVQFYNTWHYDDQPYVRDQIDVKPVNPINSVWALTQAQAILANPKSNQYEKAFAIRVLLHVVGDIHEPLHDVQLFAKQFPQGDQGGNLFLIATSDKNLHHAWDRGLGFFNQNCQLSLTSTDHARCLARQIEQDYPENLQAQDLNFQHWVTQGYQIAVHLAYQTPLNAPLSANYIKSGQKIVEQQLALAGYRLANLLNHLYG